MYGQGETANGGASARQAAKRRGGERAAITHWPCDSEPDGWLTNNLS